MMRGLPVTYGPLPAIMALHLLFTLDAMHEPEIGPYGKIPGGGNALVSAMFAYGLCWDTRPRRGNLQKDAGLTSRSTPR